MKKLGLAFLLALAVTPSVFGDDDRHRRMSGVEMGGLGVAAAAAAGAVVVLARRLARPGK